MIDLGKLTSLLRENHDLSGNEAAAAGHALASPEVPPGQKEEFLTALSQKGETAEEVAGLAGTFRDLARNPEVSDMASRAIDVCGTGGDGTGSFNISTTVLFILAAGGVPVFKHGNRSITSKCGSAELLSALGVPLEADNRLLRQSLIDLNFCFFFAPAFHPAFKAVMPVRQAMAQRGQRSVFNILGPLINPGRPAFQMVGVFSERFMPAMAGCLHAMSLQNGWIIHCRLENGRGMDELSTAGTNVLTGFGQSHGLSEEWTSARYGLQPSSLADLQGGDLQTNLAIFHRVLEGRGSAGLMDSVVLNAGAAFHLAGAADSVAEGMARAKDLLACGEVRRHVQKTMDYFRS